MNAPANSDRTADLLLVRQALDGNQSAADRLRNRYDAQLKATLCKRGATRTEADDLVADLWSDCFGSSGKPLLEKYEGRSALVSWLTTVALNRLIDLKRRQAFRGEFPVKESGAGDVGYVNQSDDFSSALPDSALTQLLRRAVMEAFAAESSEILLMLRLVHVYDITQREIGRIWNWHESKTSRTLDSARKRIRTAVLAALHRIDPWLTVEWQDFVELSKCASEIVSGTDSEISVQDRSGQ